MCERFLASAEEPAISRVMAGSGPNFTESWMAQSVARMPAESRMAVFVQDGELAYEGYRLAAVTGFPSLLEQMRAGPIQFSARDRGDHIGAVVMSRSPVCIQDCRSDPQWRIPDPSIASAYLRPIISADSVIAILGFFSVETAAFNSTARALADRLAESFEHLALAARRLAQLERAEARLATIVRVAKGRESVSVPGAAAPYNSMAYPQGVAANHRHLDPAPVTNFGAMSAEAGIDGSGSSSVENCLANLSPRERQVLAAFRRQRRVALISEELAISPHTVRNHLKSIFQKLGVHSQVELLAAVGTMNAGESEARPVIPDPSPDDLVSV